MPTECMPQMKETQLLSSPMSRWKKFAKIAPAMHKVYRAYLAQLVERAGRQPTQTVVTCEPSRGARLSNRTVSEGELVNGALGQRASVL